MRNPTRYKPTIGFICTWPVYQGTTIDRYAHSLIQGIGAAANKEGCNLLLGCGFSVTGNSPQYRSFWPVPRPNVNFVPVGPWNTDGLIIVPNELTKEQFRYVCDLLESGFPVVFTTPEGPGPVVAKVQYAIAIAGDPGYNALPMQTSFGGYVFGQTDGKWNPDDVGLDSEGMIKAVTWMKGAVDEGLMPNTTDYETGHQLFETGQIPFLMAGPWALDRIRASGVPYAVTKFPDDGAPFLGVQGFMVNAFSEGTLLAQTFLTEYVATEEFMQKIYETGLRPSAFKSVLEKTADPDLLALFDFDHRALAALSLFKQA